MAKFQNNGGRNILPRIFRGIAVSITVLLIALVITASLLSGEHMGMESVGYACGLATFISAFLGAAVAVSGAGEQKWILCAAASFVYFLLLLVVGLLLFNGRFHGVGVSALLIGGAGASAGLIGMKHKKTGKYYRGKKHF